MNPNIAFSTDANEEVAIAELIQNIEHKDPALVLFFASSSRDIEKIGKGLEAAFSTSKVVGCTTSGELVSGQMLKGSVVAMAIGHDVIEEVAISMIQNLNKGVDILPTVEHFNSVFGEDLLQMDHEKYVGITMIDGMSGKEEEVMDKLGNQTDVLFLGGSAGDDLKFEAAYVFANGKASSDAAVLILIKTRNGYDFIKTQSFERSGEQLLATKVDEGNRTVLEFDNQPAVVAYAAKVGKTKDSLSEAFMSNPLGLTIDGDIFVRSPQQVIGDGVKFYCQIKEGMKMDVLNGLNIVEDTRNALKSKLEEIGNVSSIVNFHCILRTLDLEGQGKTEDYGNVFDQVPMIGLSTYGEQFLGHVNQTSTMLLLK